MSRIGRLPVTIPSGVQVDIDGRQVTVQGPKGTRATAEAYLKFLYTKAGQEVAARNYYRPRDADLAAKYAQTFPKVSLFTIDDVFGGWRNAQGKHFADKGAFDQIYGQ